VAYWWFHEPLMKFYQEAGTLPPEQLEALMPGEVTTALLMTRVIYTVYCLAFELAWSKTPGKWLLGCTVLSETVSRPTPLQFFVRNMSRLIELELRYRIFLPFLLVLFFTRNRQRVGDLLARTIVVERDYSIVPEAEKPEEEGET
jgi:uncharacterized RDD family membrane protein YckC